MPHRNQKIFDEGWQAWTDGADISQNPYTPKGDDWSAWRDGWDAAEEDYEDRLQRDAADDPADRGDWEFHQDHDQ